MAVSSSDLDTSNQRDHSQIVKPHSGLAAAISRILCGDEATLETDASKLRNNASSMAIDSVDRTDIDITTSLRRKRGHRSLKRSNSELEENENSDEGDGSLQAKKAQSEIIKACHRLPQESSIEDEKKLQRLATRGVVQLFNAVSKHKKSLEEKLKEAGPSERKKRKVLSSVDKGGFIDMLKGNEGGGEVESSSPVPTEPTWSILKDDYMKNSKMKDWDKEDSDIYSNEE